MCELYFDVMSPYTYIAFQILKRYKTLWDLTVIFKPVNLGTIMKESGNQPPAMVPNRARFMANDLERTIKMLGLEKIFKGMPENFFSDVGKSSLLLNRILATIAESSEEGSENVWRAVDSAFAIIWEDDEYREGSLFVARKNLLQDFSKKARVQVSNDEMLEAGKVILKKNTERALELHAFGSPSLHFPNSSEKGKVFFGSDRFEQIAFLLGLPWYGPKAEQHASRL